MPDWEKIKKQLDGMANRFFSIKVGFQIFFISFKIIGLKKINLLNSFYK